MAGTRIPTDDDSDEQAWTAVAKGDVQALTGLYDRYAGMLVGVAYRVLGNRQDAEDLVHDVFVEAWGCAGDFDARRGTVRRWLLVRLRSRAIDRLRSLALLDRHRRREADGMDAERAGNEPGLEWSREDGDRLRAVLRTLPDEQRSLVELAYFDGLSHAELAMRVGAPVGTVKSRLFAAMDKLRRGLGASRGNP